MFSGIRRAEAPWLTCCICCRVVFLFLTLASVSGLVAVGGGVGACGSIIGGGGGGVGAGGGVGGGSGILGELTHIVVFL